MPNLIICLTILRFALFGPRDLATNIATVEQEKYGSDVRRAMKTGRINSAH